jgi:hypothetical protein
MEEEKIKKLNDELQECKSRLNAEVQNSEFWKKTYLDYKQRVEKCLSAIRNVSELLQ